MADKKLVAMTPYTLAAVKEVADLHARNKRIGEGEDRLRKTLPTDLVRVRNDSGGNRRAGDVLQIGSALLTDTTNANLWFAGGTPDGSENVGILRSALPDEAIGDLQVSGACMAYVDVQDESHTRASPESSSYTLTSGATGLYKILWKPSGTGELSCCVMPDSDGSSSTTTYEPVYFWEPVVIRSGESTTPTLGVDELDQTVSAGLRYTQYVGDLDAAGVEYLWFDPVTSPSTEWDDAVFRLTLGGAWRVRISWVVRPGALARYYTTPGAAPYTFASTDSGGDTVNLFVPARLQASQLVYVRDDSSSSWQQISDARLQTPLWHPVYTTGVGDASASNGAIFVAPAGAELRLRCLAQTASNVPNSASYTVEQGAIELQYLGEISTTSDRGLTVTADATDLPLAGSHTTK